MEQLYILHIHSIEKRPPQKKKNLKIVSAIGKSPLPPFTFIPNIIPPSICIMIIKQRLNNTAKVKN